MQAGETMDEIASEVMRMTKLMREIASASQEQSRGIEQVNIAVSQMDETAQQNAALVQQSSAATRSLEEQSHALIEAMASFKLRAIFERQGVVASSGYCQLRLRCDGLRGDLALATLGANDVTLYDGAWVNGVHGTICR